MQVNPELIVRNNVLIPCEYTEVQQNGVDCSVTEDFDIEHGRAFNVLLGEKVDIPSGMFATFHQRSSLSRKGIFCTTGLWDSGYSGVVGCTIYNMSGDKISFKKGDRVGQLVFWEGNSSKQYEGHYKDNADIASKI